MDRYHKYWNEQEEAVAMEMFIGGKSLDEIGRALARNVNAVRKKLDQLLRLEAVGEHNNADCGAAYIPTEQQIADGCRSIQARWSEADRLRRQCAAYRNATPDFTRSERVGGRP